MTQHATLSASGASGWMNCYGKPFMEKGLPESSSKYADEGTAAHEVAAMCLEQNQDAAAFAGRMIQVTRGEGAQATSRSFEVNEEMVEAVQRYVDIVRGLGGDLMVEQKVDFGNWIGVENQFGTSDSLVVLDKELIVVDLKYGKGVRVEAEDNPQLQLYALGCYDIAELAGYEIETVRLMIVQPRLPSVSEWVCSIDDLKAFALEAKIAARHAIHQWEGKAEPKLTPGEKQCRWCKAKATCPAAASLVLNTVSFGAASVDDFADLDEAVIGKDSPVYATISEANLGEAMAKVDLIEKWCSAVRAEVERRLVEGKPVDGFKLVAGKKGARAWADKEAAETALKAMRLKQDEMYDYSLISPTTAEKLAKSGKLGDRQWKKLCDDHITQTQGKPSVAPVSDKRPAITVAVTADDFATLPDEGGDLA